MTLTEFLLARIAEDEAVARDEFVRDRWDEGPVYFWQYSEEDAAIATSTARVLAECEAKRCIAHLHGPKPGASDECKSCAQGWEDLTYGDAGFTPEPYPCLTAKNLALPYADHPDYRDEWRP